MTPLEELKAQRAIRAELDADPSIDHVILRKRYGAREPDVAAAMLTTVEKLDESIREMSVQIKRFVVNEHLDIAREPGGKIRAYVNGKPFIQCMRLILTIPLGADTREITSIDEAVKQFGSVYQGAGMEPAVKDIQMDPDEEFVGHCSNIQAWVENDYAPGLLHSTIAYPLLKELADAGDEKAKRVFEGEVANRIKTGSRASIMALVESLGPRQGDLVFKFLMENTTIPVKEQALNLWYKLALKECKMERRRAIDAIVLREPSEADSWYLLGKELNASEDCTGAVIALEKAISIDQGHERARELLADMFTTLKEWRRAHDAFSWLIHVLDAKRGASSSKHWREYAFSMYKLGDGANAIAPAKRATEIDPLDKYAWNRLGLIYKSQGCFKDADAAYASALKIDINFATAWNNASSLLVENGALKPHFRGKFEARNIALAVHRAENAVMCAPGEAIHHTTLGEALEAAGDNASAIQEYKKALEIDPGEEYAIKDLQRLLSKLPLKMGYKPEELNS
ncbi:MAG: tetratricopeptide repeat protein [Candidatus Lokiarchaeota archaeon]|nr:tetratricopeptide repeat protein [Candidatus Lokiarchaeota archaeon]